MVPLRDVLPPPAPPQEPHKEVMDPRARRILQVLIVCVAVGVLATYLLQRVIDGALERMLLTGVLWLGLLGGATRTTLEILQPRERTGGDQGAP